MSVCDERNYLITSVSRDKMSLTSNGSVCYGCVMRRNCKYQPRESLEHPQVSFTVSSNGPVLRRAHHPSYPPVSLEQSREISGVLSLGGQERILTKLTGLLKILRERFAIIISMIDWSQNTVKIFC